MEHSLDELYLIRAGSAAVKHWQPEPAAPCTDCGRPTAQRDPQRCLLCQADDAQAEAILAQYAKG